MLLKEVVVELRREGTQRYAGGIKAKRVKRFLLQQVVYILILVTLNTEFDMFWLSPGRDGEPYIDPTLHNTTIDVV